MKRIAAKYVSDIPADAREVVVRPLRGGDGAIWLRRTKCMLGGRAGGHPRLPEERPAARSGHADRGRAAARAQLLIPRRWRRRSAASRIAGGSPTASATSGTTAAPGWGSYRLRAGRRLRRVARAAGAAQAIRLRDPRHAPGPAARLRVVVLAARAGRAVVRAALGARQAPRRRTDVDNLGLAREGVPKFWVAGKPVSQREYLRKAAKDRTLPRLRDDDANARHIFRAASELYSPEIG